MLHPWPCMEPDCTARAAQGSSWLTPCHLKQNIKQNTLGWTWKTKMSEGWYVSIHISTKHINIHIYIYLFILGSKERPRTWMHLLRAGAVLRSTNPNALPIPPCPKLKKRKTKGREGMQGPLQRSDPFKTQPLVVLPVVGAMHGCPPLWGGTLWQSEAGKKKDLYIGTPVVRWSRWWPPDFAGGHAACTMNLARKAAKKRAQTPPNALHIC